MTDPEEIEQAVAEACRVLRLQQWPTWRARALGDALVWMGYAVWRTGPDGKPVLQPDREKFIVDAAAAGYYGDAGCEKFIGERGREYMAHLEQQEAPDGDDA